MDEKLRKDLEQFMSSYNTMRKYQRAFFDGNKSALRTAIYHENQTDNFAKKVEVEHGLKVTVSRGDASQQSLL
jgi:hypothetical protein